MQPSSTAVLQAYAAVWAESDAPRCAALIATCLTEEAQIIGPGYHFRGHAAIAAEVARFHRQQPGLRAVLASGPDGHHGVARFAVAVIGADGQVAAEGEDIVEWAADGRIARVLTFWGALPPLPASWPAALCVPRPAAAAALDQVTLRPATIADAVCLGVLATQVFLDTYATAGIRAPVAREVLGAFSTASLERLLNQAATSIIVAEAADHLVGFAQLTFGTGHELVTMAPPAELDRLYVQEPFTRQGLGTALLAAAEALGARHGARVLWLTPWVHNRRALRFYATHGYADLGPTVFRIEGETHENRVLFKSLDPSSAS